MLWLWIVIIAEIVSVIAGVWFYLKRVKGLELQLKQEAEARTQEALELAVAVEARKHLEEASERMLDDVKTLLLVRDQLHDDLDDRKQEIETLKKEVRHQKGRAQSAHSSKGQILEKWTPFLTHEQIDEAWKPEDWSFLGNPLDYVVWEWYQDKEKNMAEGKVVLLDVKAAKSQLTTKQRRIRDLIKAGRVEWREIRLD